MNKRLTGALNWHSARSSIHDMAVFASVLADIRAQGPDHVALTGDLVNVGYEPEFPLALAAIAELGSPADVSIVPGNHDAYIRSSLPAMETIFRPYMTGDGARKVGFPYLRRRGGIALIGVNSGVPTLPFFATGRVGHDQRHRLAALLDATRAEGLYRIVMIHHPPLKRASRFGRNLRDQRQFADLLHRHGAELVLHGHNHRHSLHFVDGPSGRVPILGVASASAVPGTPRHRAEYHLIRIDPAARRAEIIRRADRGGAEGIVDLGRIPLANTPN